MPNVSPIFAEETANLFTPADKLELLAQIKPGGGGSWSVRDNAETCVVMIKAEKRRSAISWILGYAWADTEAPWKLHRTAPLQHPEFDDLHAVGIADQPFNPVGDVGGQPGNAPRRDALPGSEFTHYGRYTRDALTIRFGPLDFAVPPDVKQGDESWLWAGNEWERWVMGLETEGRLQVVSANVATNILFAHGPEGGMVDAGPAVKGTAIPSKIYAPILEGDITLTWLQVPEAYLFKNNQPVKINSVVGKCNSAPFMGFPTGSLLMHPPRIGKRYRQRVRTVDNAPLYCRDVHLKMRYFAPPADKIGAGAPVGVTGHNFFPTQSDRLFYYACEGSISAFHPTVPTLAQLNASKPMILFADFAKAFEHASAP